jgi:hypothetical protein
MVAGHDLPQALNEVGNVWLASRLSLQESLTIGNWTQRMKDFSNASFSPGLIKATDQALEGAVATLPHPVSPTRVQNIAENILRCAKQGESNPGHCTRWLWLKCSFDLVEIIPSCRVGMRS